MTVSPSLNPDTSIILSTAMDKQPADTIEREEGEISEDEEVLLPTADILLPATANTSKVKHQFGTGVTKPKRKRHRIRKRHFARQIIHFNPHHMAPGANMNQGRGRTEGNMGDRPSISQQGQTPALFATPMPSAINEHQPGSMHQAFPHPYAYHQTFPAQKPPIFDANLPMHDPETIKLVTELIGMGCTVEDMINYGIPAEIVTDMITQSRDVVGNAHTGQYTHAMQSSFQPPTLYPDPNNRTTLPFPDQFYQNTPEWANTVPHTSASVAPGAFASQTGHPASIPVIQASSPAKATKRPVWQTSSDTSVPTSSQASASTSASFAQSILPPHIESYAKESPRDSFADSGESFPMDLGSGTETLKSSAATSLNSSLNNLASSSTLKRSYSTRSFIPRRTQSCIIDVSDVSDDDDLDRHYNIVKEIQSKNKVQSHAHDFIINGIAFRSRTKGTISIAQKEAQEKEHQRLKLLEKEQELENMKKKIAHLEKTRKMKSKLPSAPIEIANTEPATNDEADSLNGLDDIGSQNDVSSSAEDVDMICDSENDSVTQFTAEKSDIESLETEITAGEAEVIRVSKEIVFASKSVNEKLKKVELLRQQLLEAESELQEAKVASTELTEKKSVAQQNLDDNKKKLTEAKNDLQLKIKTEETLRQLIRVRKEKEKAERRKQEDRRILELKQRLEAEKKELERKKEEEVRQKLEAERQKEELRKRREELEKQLKEQRLWAQSKRTISEIEQDEGIGPKSKLVKMDKSLSTSSSPRVGIPSSQIQPPSRAEELSQLQAKVSQIQREQEQLKVKLRKDTLTSSLKSAIDTLIESLRQPYHHPAVSSEPSESQVVSPQTLPWPSLPIDPNYHNLPDTIDLLYDFGKLPDDSIGSLDSERIDIRSLNDLCLPSTLKNLGWDINENAIVEDTLFLDKEDTDSSPTTATFVPYTSPLYSIRSLQLESTDNVKGIKKSTDTPSKFLCSYESRGGQCNDPSCTYLHFKDFEMNDDDFLLEIVSSMDGVPVDKIPEYRTTLADNLESSLSNKLPLEEIISSVSRIRSTFVDPNWLPSPKPKRKRRLTGSGLGAKETWISDDILRDDSEKYNLPEKKLPWLDGLLKSCLGEPSRAARYYEALLTQDDFEELLKKDPENEALWIRYAIDALPLPLNFDTLQNQNLMVNSVKILARAVTIHPSPTLFDFYLELYSRISPEKQVRDAFQKAIKKLPSCWKIWWRYYAWERDPNAKETVGRKMMDRAFRSSAEHKNQSANSSIVLDIILQLTHHYLVNHSFQSAHIFLHHSLTVSDLNETSSSSTLVPPDDLTTSLSYKHMNHRDFCIAWLAFLHLSHFQTLPKSFFYEHPHDYIVRKQYFLIKWDQKEVINSDFLDLTMQSLMQCWIVMQEPSARHSFLVILRNFTELLRVIGTAQETIYGIVDHFKQAERGFAELWDLSASVGLAQGDHTRADVSLTVGMVELPYEISLWNRYARYLASQNRKLKFAECLCNCVRQFYVDMYPIVVTEDNVQDAVEESLMLYSKALGMPNSLDLQGPSFRPDFYEQQPKTSLFMWLNYLSLQYISLNTDQVELKPIFDAAIESVKSLDDKMVLWKELLQHLESSGIMRNGSYALTTLTRAFSELPPFKKNPYETILAIEYDYVKRPPVRDFLLFNDFVHISLKHASVSLKTDLIDSLSRRYYDNVELLLCSGKVNYECGQLKQAAQKLYSALNLNPYDAAIWRLVLAFEKFSPSSQKSVAWLLKSSHNYLSQTQISEANPMDQ